jgi:dienelactone hydrolase
MKTVLFALAVAVAARSGASVKGEVVNYRSGQTALRGYLAYDDASAARRPAVLIVHEWTGLGDHVRQSAERLAAAGHLGFAVDMYGDGKVARDTQEAARWAGEVRSNPAVIEARFRAALDHARKHPLADPARVAAIGYCFGGTVCLEAARAGVDVLGVVSFHGGLASQIPPERRKPTAKVLVLHGADDPTIPAAQLQAFQDEMRAARADWQLISYGNAVHSFTNPAANSAAARYEERAARRSWGAMTQFLGELFAR